MEMRGGATGHRRELWPAAAVVEQACGELACGGSGSRQWWLGWPMAEQDGTRVRRCDVGGRRWLSRRDESREEGGERSYGRIEYESLFS